MAPTKKTTRKTAAAVAASASQVVSDTELVFDQSQNGPDLYLDASCSSSNAFSGAESTGDKKYARVNRMVLDKESDEYRKRRERNNQAVKRSRQKSKNKTVQTLDRVNQLKKENETLESKITILTKELTFLKELFLTHSKTGAPIGGPTTQQMGQMLNNIQLSATNKEQHHT